MVPSASKRLKSDLASGSESHSQESESESSQQPPSSEMELPNLFYTVRYQNLFWPIPLPARPSYQQLIQLSKTWFKIDVNVDLELFNASGSGIPANPNDVLDPGTFTLKQAAAKVVPKLKENRFLEEFSDICWKEYSTPPQTGTTEVESQALRTIDLRRACSLLRWRCINRKIALELMRTRLEAFESVKQQLETTLVAKEQIDAISNVQTPDENQVHHITCQDELERLDVSFVEEADESNGDVYKIPAAFSYIHLRHFRFSRDSRIEIQFHKLWEGILSAAIGLRSKTFALYTEYLTSALVPDTNIELKASQLIDYIMFYEGYKNHFAALFVEIAGSCIDPKDDHKDIQKMIGNMCRYALHLIGVLLKARPDLTCKQLEALRVFGIFITRFAYDFVVVKPTFDNDDPNSVAFIVEIEREDRRHLVTQKNLSECSSKMDTSTDQDRQAPTQVNFDYALGIDMHRPIQEDQEADSNVDSNAFTSENIHAALQDVKANNLLPLFRFGHLVRKYCYSMKSLFDIEGLSFAGDPSLATLLPKPVSGRRSAKDETPGRERPIRRESGRERSSRREPFTSPQPTGRFSSRSQMALSDVVDLQVLYEQSELVIVAFQRVGSSSRWVLKESHRDTASNEVDIVQRLLGSTFVPFVAVCEWIPDDRCSVIVSEQLVEICPNIGSDMLSRSMDQLCLMRDLIQSLAYVHGQRILHRDISSGNVMYSLRDRRYKLIDFEFACLLPDGSDTITEKNLIGTEPFIDPVVRDSNQYSFASDWYSLGRVCALRIQEHLWCDLGQWEHVRALSDLSDDIVDIALLMCRNREIPVEADQLLSTIETIIRRIADLKNPSSSS